METIRIVKGELRVPVEIYVAWGQPRSLAVRCDSGSVLVHVPMRRVLIDRARWIISSIRTSRARFLRVDLVEDCAVFDLGRLRMADGSYLIANYHPLYFLMGQRPEKITNDSVDRGNANAKFWREVEKYHEHLPLAKQDEEAHEISQLLVSKVRALAGEPKSILELGCGAGRNLLYIGNAFPDAKVQGIDINPAGITSREMPENVTIRQGDILNLDWEALGDFDVIFTAGFLMHINHNDVRNLMMSVHRHSKFHLHFELHGPSFEWDYHRYPRSYRKLMNEIGLPQLEYAIFARHKVYSYGLSSSFAHALLTSSSLANQ